MSHPGLLGGASLLGPIVQTPHYALHSCQPVSDTGIIAHSTQQTSTQVNLIITTIIIPQQRPSYSRSRQRRSLSPSAVEVLPTLPIGPRRAIPEHSYLLAYAQVYLFDELFLKKFQIPSCHTLSDALSSAIGTPGIRQNNERIQRGNRERVSA